MFRLKLGLMLFYMLPVNQLLNFFLFYRSNVYAVNRNIEDPAKITPLIPNSETTSVTEVEDEQVQPTPSGCFAADFLFGDLFSIPADAESKLMAFEQ